MCTEIEYTTNLFSLSKMCYLMKGYGTIIYIRIAWTPLTGIALLAVNTFLEGSYASSKNNNLTY
jgi:hypothetical protein